MKRARILLIFCLLVTWLALFYQIGNLAFIGADEPRYARIAEEMLLRGDFITPTLNFDAWLEKPPLLYWVEAISFSVLGISETAARLPVALLAFLAALALALLARHVAGEPAGGTTFLVLLTTILFVVYARAASTDMPLVACFTLAVVFGYQSSGRRWLRWSALSGFALGLAVLAKGPVALILFAAIFFIFFLADDFVPRPLSVAVGLSAFLLTAGPWFWMVYQIHGNDFLITFWINHHWARYLTDVHHHSQPFWYYLPILLLGLFPWWPFLGTSFSKTFLVRTERDEAGRFRLFLWIWGLLPIFFFSLSQSKLPGYILPSIPPLAALAALEWKPILQAATPGRRFRNEIKLLGGFSVLFVITLIVFLAFIYDSVWLAMMMGTVATAGVSWGVICYQRRRWTALFLGIVATMTVLLALAYWRTAPVVENFHSAKDLSLFVSDRVTEEEPLVFYRYFHHTANYYTGYQTAPSALETPRDLRDYFRENPQGSYFLLTQADGWRELRDKFNARLIRDQGNLYLVEIDTR